MNVFWLDDDPRTAASYHADQHVSKMLLEAAQILSTAARLNGAHDPDLYRATHEKHPAVLWAAESRANWTRLNEFARALNAEYVERFDHDEPHASWRMLQGLDSAALPLPEGPATEPPQCMPEEYQGSDLVDAYRRYYASEKQWAEWNHSPAPDWLDDYRLAADDPAGDATA
jgi:hypothetical protein